MYVYKYIYIYIYICIRRPGAPAGTRVMSRYTDNIAQQM